MQYSEFRLQFEQPYIELIEKMCIRASARGVVGHTDTAINYLRTLAKDGKRIRPFLIFHSYTLMGGSTSIMSLLYAVELLHFFALIHDDIMDNAPYRRGVPTAHTYLNEKYKESEKARSQAILLGDLVLQWSYEQFHKGISIFPEHIREQVTLDFNSLVEEMIVGQMMDVDMAKNEPASFDQVLRKNTLKSGNYTFVWPLLIGADLAGADEKRRSFLRMLGEYLGTAFQSQDDLLDVMEETGKERCGDIEEGQQTILTAFMFTHAFADDREQFIKYYGSRLTNEEKSAMVSLLQNSGAFLFTESLIEDSFKNAQSLVAEYALEEIGSWNHIVELLKGRKK
jgi:geranylgeranyl pyrophosphate synthase